MSKTSKSGARPKRVYRQIEAGKWFTFGTGDKLTCCDCGLVHVYEVALKREKGKDVLLLRCWRDERSTAATRRERRKRGAV